MLQDTASRRVRFGRYVADFETQEIWKDGVRLRLARQPFEILEMLVTRPGELVSREELQKRLWADGHFVDADHGLNAAVNKLREALCDSAEDPKYIETLPRRGYRFTGKVDAAETTADSAPSESGVELQAAQMVPAPPLSIDHLSSATIPESVARPNRRWTILAAASVALVAGALIGAALKPGTQNPNTPSTTAVKEADEQGETSANRVIEPEIAAHPEANAEAPGRERLIRPIVSLPARESDIEPRPAEFRTIIPGESGNAAPQFSPDGRRIAFMSNRSGPWQIWMSNADGSDPVQVSFTDSAGTPRWAPDGKSFVFDAPWEGTTFVFLSPVTQPQNARPIAEGYVPSFSRDGKFVYFASDRTGDFQVWRVAVAGGPEVQVTRGGGFAALESQDGNIYYSKSKYPNPEVWRIPASGGEEVAISPILRPRTWASWTVTKDGVLLVADLPDGRSHLTLYNPETRVARDLTSLPTSPFWMSASADGKRVVMNDSAERQITLLETLP